MNREMPGLPVMSLPSVDVRDVALGHVRAMMLPGLHGKRILLNKESAKITDFADMLDAEFKQFGFRVQTRRIGFCPLKMASYFDSQVKLILPFIGIDLYAENTVSKEVLGLTYDRWTLKETIVQMGYSLIEKGLVPDKRPKH